jgi:peptide/nickel transport system permease protein/peptide/nickel transport system substrate-binding protein
MQNKAGCGLALRVFFVLATCSACASAAFADAKNNTLTIGVAAEPFTLDPANGLSGNDYPYLYAIFDRILTYDPTTLEPRPGLAESWEFTGENNQTFRFKLRPNLKFQDGTTLDAEAVKESLTHFKQTGRIHDLDVVTSINVTDPLTIELKLNKPFSPLTAVLADRAGMVSSPTAIKQYGKDYDRHPVGAGPFSVKDWRPGSYLQLTAFPDYWNKQRIKLAGMTFRIIPNGTSLIAAALTGQVDYAYNLESKSAASLLASSNIRVAVEPSLQFNMINVNAGYPPMDNALVRRAVAMSIDRDALASVSLGPVKGHGSTTLPVPPSSFASDPQYAHYYKYDPEEAKKLLTQGGFANGVTLKICANPNLPGFGTDMTDVEREQMRPVGINLDVTVLTGSGCLQAFDIRHDFPIWQGGFSGRPHPYMTYQAYFGTNGAYNKEHTKFPGVDELLDRIASTYTTEDQKKLFAELDKLWVEQMPIIPLFFRPNLSVYSKAVEGEIPNAQGKPDPTSLHFVGQ